MCITRTFDPQTLRASKAERSRGILDPRFPPTSEPIVSNLSGIAIQTDINLEQLRARLHKMSDAELIRFGKAARFLCRPGKEPPREAFVVELREARAEWRR